MTRILLGGIALLALIGAANAADLPAKYPVKAPPLPAAPAYTWDGFYLGGYFGNSLSQSTASTPSPGVPVGTNPGFVNINNDGWTGGGTAGYNLQIGPSWLVGVEGDFGYLGGTKLFAEWNDVIATGEKNSWYATARGRIGYVTGPSLLYVTGGAGFVHVTDTFGGDALTSTMPVSSSTTTVGGAFGAGIETKLSRNWTTKTEYLYIDGGGNHSFASNSEGIPGTPTTFSHSFQVIKTGFNYRFDGPVDGLPFFNAPLLATNHNWNGFYVGGNAGIGSSLTQIYGINSGIPGNENLNGTGFTGGGQVGYNYIVWQKYLVGVEGDFGAFDSRHTVTDWNDPGVTFSQKTSWIGTARVRVGTTTGPALLYTTGGFAWVNMEDGVVPNPGGGVAGGLGTRTGTGWTWGGGAEVALDAHWSAKVESLYVNSGTSTHDTFAPAGGFPAQFKDRFVIVRFGLNYALN